MALDNYGVLVGQVTDKYFDKDKSPHLHMLIHAPEKYDISVNVQSGVFFSTQPREGVPPNQVLFLVKDPFDHPILARLEKLEPGFHKVPRQAGGVALDFIRGNLFDPALMNPLPANVDGPNNDLFDKMGFYVEKAIADPSARVYAFGEPWPKTDKLNGRFNFTPDQGIHDIHMNQGNDPDHAGDDAVWQDGALFFRFGETWVGIFIAFQAQCWHTDDRTGAALAGFCARPPVSPSSEPPVNDATVRIVGVTPNPFGADSGFELVHLFNVLDKDRKITGWRLIDSRGNYEYLEGQIPANGVLRVQLSGKGCTLSNSGDTLSLLDEKGLKVDGISYTRSQVSRGVSIVF